MLIRGFAFSLWAGLLVHSLGAQAPTLNPAPAKAVELERLGWWVPAELDGPSHQVTQVKFTAGHTVVILEEGSAAYVRQGGKRVGVYFRGKGNLEYLSTQKEEFYSAKYNLKKNASLDWRETDKGLRIADRFTELYFRTAGGEVPALDGPVAGSLEFEFKSVLSSLNNNVEVPFSHLLVQQALHPTATAEWINAWGGRDNLQVICDGAVTFEERFEILKRNTQMSSKSEFPWHTVPLSKQTIGWNLRHPISTPFVLTDVDLDVTASANARVRIVATQTFDPVASGQRALNLELIHTKYQASHTGTLISHRYKLLSVMDEKGHSLPFHHDPSGELQVRLAEVPTLHQAIKLRFETEGDIIFQPKGDSYWALGTEAWMPLPRRWSGQYFKVHALVKVAKPFVPVVGGTTIRRGEENGFNVQEIRIDKPVQFFTIMGGDYKFIEDTRNGQTVRISFYSGISSNAKDLMNLAFGVISYYNRVLGPFPFKEFNIIQRNEYGYGQAPPGVMFITNEAFGPSVNDESKFLRMAYSQGINQRIAHEIAHQYWGNEIKMASPEEQWITEAFSEFCSSLVLGNINNLGKGKREALLRHWKDQADEVKSVCTIPMANSLNDPNNSTLVFWTRFKLIYFKGAWLLHVLNQKVGDAAFARILRTFIRNHSWDFANTEDFLQTVNAVTKQDWRPFFEENYWGLGLPDVP